MGYSKSNIMARSLSFINRLESYYKVIDILVQTNPASILAFYALISPIKSLLYLSHSYGLFGPLVYCFGSVNVWKLEFNALNSDDPSPALDFRKLMQDESNMAAITVSFSRLWE